FGISPDRETSAWTNWQEPLRSISSSYERKFYTDEFNDFAARMQWAAEGQGNRNPVVRIDGKEGLLPLEVTAPAGASLRFDASASTDPDGDSLRFDWWFQEFPSEADHSPAATPALADATSPTVTFNVPATPGQQYHLICEVHDDGPFTLPAYRRIIITVE
ncbi:MAG: hypothetical protein J6T07_05755, partial [Bacteroidales bacterium]|nr:hypothetical protein [Bacteroidales bacterium]